MSTSEKTINTIAIVGGGITGLAAAYKIQEQAKAKGLPVRFVLIEAEKSLGGKITTHHEDGFTIEGGPDCFLRQKPWAAELTLKLGLGDALLGTNDHQRKTYVLNRGRLAPLPDGVMLIVPTRIMPFATSTLISWPGKIRMGMDLFIPRRSDDADESIGDFVRRRLGTEALEKIAEPLLSGIHVSDPEQQSLLGTFPRFRNIEKKHGSLIKGMLAERKAAADARKKAAAMPPSNTPQTIFLSMRNGMSQLVKTLEAKLTDGEILRGVQVLSLARADTGSYRLTLSNGEVLDTDSVILATPAYVSGSLVQSMDAGTAEMLNAFRYVSTATISIAYRKQDIRKPFMGFGFVVPKKEKRKITACTWSSFKFNHRAPDDALLLRCFVGGPGHEDLVDLEDGAMLAMVKRELRELLHIEAEPVIARIYRWRKANPQYDLGHLDRVKEIQSRLKEFPGLYVTGSAFEGVGIPDCIHQGSQTAELALGFCEKLQVQLVPTA